MSGIRRVIDHRRHTMRRKPGEHLSQAGVELARRVGAGEFGPIPRYDLVVTSPQPRALETAIAIGFAVDEQLDALWMGDAANDLPLDFGKYAEQVHSRPRLGLFVDELARALVAAVARLPEDGTALVVSHGGVVELSAVALLPAARHELWAPPIGYAEGIRLIFEGSDCVAAEPLRVGADDYLVEN
jgi:broad specificity phosphatase PhoE